MSAPGVADVGYYGGGVVHTVIAIAFFSVNGLVWMWMLRRFGFTSMLVVWIVQFSVMFTPLTTTGWMAGPSVAQHLIPVLVGAWALWVILSAQKWPAGSEPTA